VARRAGAALAPALTTPGPFGVCVGLALAVRYPGPVGGTVLACAAAATVLGEVLSPLALRRALARAGECGASRANGAEAGAQPEATP
jgi:pimeloyl-ACP methyl ester carboxylesterase